MWAYRSFELPVNVFDFTVSRHRDGPDEILRDYTGVLMGDCWSGFQKIELRSDARIQRAACWAHARKIFEGRSSHPQQASVLLALIRELYDIEDRAKTFSPAERRPCASENRFPCWRTSAALWPAMAWRRRFSRHLRRGPELPAESLGRLESVRNGRPPADRQQRRRTVDETGRGRPQKLAVRGEPRSGDAARRRC